MSSAFPARRISTSSTACRALEDQADPDPARAGRGLHGRDLRPASPARPACAWRRSGPGATNFVTAAAYAQLGGMPMMMITGQKPIKKSKQGRFQILDVVAMMGPITKFTHQLASSDNIPSRVREAFRLAEEEKPGAVHLELPEDIADEQTDSRPLHAQPGRAGPRPTRRRCARAVEEDRGGEVARAGDRRGRQPQDDQPDAAPADREDRHSVRHHPARQGRDRRDPPASSSAARRSPPATSSTGRSRRADLSSTSATT